MVCGYLIRFFWEPEQIIAVDERLAENKLESLSSPVALPYFAETFCIRIAHFSLQNMCFSKRKIVKKKTGR